MKQNPEQEPSLPAAKKIAPEKAAQIVKALGVEFDGEQFRINTHFANGKEATHVVLGRDIIDDIPIEEYIRAVQELYPTVKSHIEFMVEFMGMLKRRANSQPQILKIENSKKYNKNHCSN